MMIQTYAVYLRDVQIDGKYLTGLLGEDRLEAIINDETVRVLSISESEYNNRYLLRCGDSKALSDALQKIHDHEKESKLTIASK